MSRQVGHWRQISIQQLQLVALDISKLTAPPAVIFLSGEVGAGKTTFSKVFVDNPDLTSPTYSLINEYGSIAHADFYRIKSASELVHLEMALYLENKQYFLIEWGMPFFDEITKLLDSFSFYELKITPCEGNDSLRNLLLKQC
ncbi:MAG: tRNA (adenosine(37)-N6)-threonylcarbamoyltransferase complex ATPase subunit type 1 TsaE [Bacteriovoracaceae bacterium]|nr:tRNA (adenosine(37)-N6)-threonylcarbamoyltransferase complex ATPase subunit type 1 TsaE [Bacteriovoracaceae bacterium]